VLSTHRLSPKNQVTIPSKSRALLAGADGALHALPHAMPKGGTQQVWPIVLLLTAAELNRREQLILADAALAPSAKAELVTRLRGLAEELAVDQQNRVVLPQAFVQRLGLDRDVFFVVTSSAIQVWNPDHYRQWAGIGEDGLAGYTPALDSYLFT
jgi:DNA-binding transcriptional regulator/RsmH inhibitor MraZ